MDLKTYINGLPDEKAKEAFGVRCGTTIGHLRNVMAGRRPCSHALAAAIEIESHGGVTRQTLCEDWRRVWPELAAASPTKPARKETAKPTARGGIPFPEPSYDCPQFGPRPDVERRGAERRKDAADVSVRRVSIRRKGELIG